MKISASSLFSTNFDGKLRQHQHRDAPPEAIFISHWWQLVGWCRYQKRIFYAARKDGRTTGFPCQAINSNRDHKIRWWAKAQLLSIIKTWNFPKYELNFIEMKILRWYSAVNWNAILQADVQMPCERTKNVWHSILNGAFLLRIIKAHKIIEFWYVMIKNRAFDQAFITFHHTFTLGSKKVSSLLYCSLCGS